MGEKWSKERIWEWYNSRPWIRGCNYMSADCANRIDQWQKLGFEERLETTDKELALMAKTGFNSIRIILEYIVWKEQHDGFMERFDRYLDVCSKHGISCMVVFGNDCMRPKGLEINQIGEQKVDLGYHGGRKLSQHGDLGIGYSLLDEPDLALEHYEMVREIVTKYKNDERIIIWDVFNEPGASKRGSMSLPHMLKYIEIIREIDPIQPITVGIFNEGKLNLSQLTEIERAGVENSDIISYHDYCPYETNIQILNELKKLGRPILNTEWLARCVGSNVEELFPLFFLENVGCYNWGFVAGKYQTYEPWNSIWDSYEKNPDIKWDFTKWFHDLYRPNHRPYNPVEINLIKKFCALADENFEIKKERGANEC
jgi:hypothetical protein